jgi:hypothetical protein
MKQATSDRTPVMLDQVEIARRNADARGKRDLCQAKFLAAATDAASDRRPVHEPIFLQSQFYKLKVFLF